MKRRDGTDWAAYSPMSDALREAMPIIAKNRRRMTVEDAEDVIARALQRHGAQMHPRQVRFVALHAHRGPFWIFRHPVLAYREGYRFEFPWRRDNTDSS